MMLSFKGKYQVNVYPIENTIIRITIIMGMFKPISNENIIIGTMSAHKT